MKPEIKINFYLPEMPVSVEADIYCDDDGSEWPEILGVSIWGTSLKMDMIPATIMAELKDRVFLAHQVRCLTEKTSR